MMLGTQCTYGGGTGGSMGGGGRGGRRGGRPGRGGVGVGGGGGRGGAIGLGGAAGPSASSKQRKRNHATAFGNTGAPRNVRPRTSPIWYPSARPSTVDATLGAWGDFVDACETVWGSYGNDHHNLATHLNLHQDMSPKEITHAVKEVAHFCFHLHAYSLGTTPVMGQIKAALHSLEAGREAQVSNNRWWDGITSISPDFAKFLRADPLRGGVFEALHDCRKALWAHPNQSGAPAPAWLMRPLVPAWLPPADWTDIGGWEWGECDEEGCGGGGALDGDEEFVRVHVSGFPWEEEEFDGEGDAVDVVVEKGKGVATVNIGDGDDGGDGDADGDGDDDDDDDDDDGDYDGGLFGEGEDGSLGRILEGELQSDGGGDGDKDDTQDPLAPAPTSSPTSAPTSTPTSTYPPDQTPPNFTSTTPNFHQHRSAEYKALCIWMG
ncbi:hypothetical protein HK104_001130 [Borealophlyctis nickersoniae]|nr:hypothetical protein HK104_001130 [Borealophlyctis nickersoniae]